MAYESPIEKIFGEIHNEVMRKDEENLMTVVSQTVGYTVNRTELLKALRYDRQQYDKGYADAENTYKNKWIPVSERLPENSGNYLITYCYGGKIETQEAVYVVGEEDKWFDTTDIEITLAVIAWMPLPKPYKESE